MADLVRVRIDGIEKNVGAEYAEIHGLTVLDEPTHNDDGSLRAETRKDGRPAKQKTTVDRESAKKESKS